MLSLSNHTLPVAAYPDDGGRCPAGEAGEQGGFPHQLFGFAVQSGIAQMAWSTAACMLSAMVAPLDLAGFLPWAGADAADAANAADLADKIIPLDVGPNWFSIDTDDIDAADGAWLPPPEELQQVVDQAVDMTLAGRRIAYACEHDHDSPSVEAVRAAVWTIPARRPGTLVLTEGAFRFHGNRGGVVGLESFETFSITLAVRALAVACQGSLRSRQRGVMNIIGLLGHVAVAGQEPYPQNEVEARARPFVAAAAREPMVHQLLVQAVLAKTDAERIARRDEFLSMPEAWKAYVETLARNLLSASRTPRDWHASAIHLLDHPGDADAFNLFHEQAVLLGRQDEWEHTARELAEIDPRAKLVICLAAEHYHRMSRRLADLDRETRTRSAEL